MDMNKNRKSDSIGFGIASLVLGILALVFFCTCINVIAGILAIVFGIIQLTQYEKKGLAIGGLVTGIIGVLLTILLYTSVFVNYDPGMNGYENGSFGDIYDGIYNDIYDEVYQDIENDTL